MTNKSVERPTVVENIHVLQVGKFGVRVDEKTWFGVNEPLTPENFVANNGYKVSVVVSKTGKKYINEIIGVAEETSSHEAPKASAPAPAPETKMKTAPSGTKSANPTRAGFGQQLTDYDMAVQRQISRAGVWQAAAQAPITGMATNVDEYLSFVRKIADAGMLYVTE